jgi:energy-coupling factor transporter ATP-binding protein EcfA2
MTIRRIKVENIKGAASLDLDLQVIPNKPSLMVAPNGFGKSSITAAFLSLIPSKLKLDKENLHKGDEKLKPKLTIEVQMEDGTIETLEADETKNAISKSFDVYVINSRLEAKATKRNMGGFTSASASLEINEVVLIDKIPEKTAFNYSAIDSKTNFGANGKILPNIGKYLSSFVLAGQLLQNADTIAKLSGDRIQTKLQSAINQINQQVGTAEQILTWMANNVLLEFEGVECLKLVADLVSQLPEPPNSRAEAILAAYQICNLFIGDPKSFKMACAHSSYLSDKESFTQLIESFDTTWVNVKPREHKGKLSVQFPKAFHISNGQRDSLCFAALMQRAKKTIGKKDCILVIDEVFDYLDDANLTAVQYYVSTLIDDIKSKGKKIYPLIFTHLNPAYFKNYAFSSQKIYFLNKRPPSVSEHFRKLIVKREDATIKAGIERHHLHYDPQATDLQAQFKALGLKETWGCSNSFYSHIAAEWDKYKKNQDDYDPFAICCFVRVEIEKQIYTKINEPQHQQQFIDTHGTKNKLNYAKNIGVQVPEVCYLLGVIYNEGMHYRNNSDNSTPIVSKLENLVIRRMIVLAING